MYVGTLVITKSLTSLSDSSRMSLFRECMTRVQLARQAYDNGQEVINVEFNKSDHEAPGTLLREYIKEELTIAVIPIDLILSVDEAKLVDTEGSQLVHQMNAISYIGDHFAKNMISYVVKEPEVGMTEPIRRCYVFQVDDARRIPLTSRSRTNARAAPIAPSAK